MSTALNWIPYVHFLSNYRFIMFIFYFYNSSSVTAMRTQNVDLIYCRQKQKVDVTPAGASAMWHF